MPNVPPKGLFGRVAPGQGAGLAAVDLVATLVGETTPRNVLEVWGAGADRVPILVWARAAESPSVAPVISYSQGTFDVTVNWTALDPLRSDGYEIRRPDGSLAGTATQFDTEFVDTATRALTGSYTVAGVLGGVVDGTPASSNSLSLAAAPASASGTWDNGGQYVALTWAQPSYGQPEAFHIYRNGAYIWEVPGYQLGFFDGDAPRGTQPTYTIYAVLSGTLGAGRTTAAVNVPAYPPNSINVTYDQGFPSPYTRHVSWNAPSGSRTGFTIKYSSFYCGIGLTTVATNQPGTSIDISVPTCQAAALEIYVFTESAGGQSDYAYVFGK